MPASRARKQKAKRARFRTLRLVRECDRGTHGSIVAFARTHTNVCRRIIFRAKKYANWILRVTSSNGVARLGSKKGSFTLSYPLSRVRVDGIGDRSVRNCPPATRKLYLLLTPPQGVFNRRDELRPEDVRENERWNSVEVDLEPQVPTAAGASFQIPKHSWSC